MKFNFPLGRNIIPLFDHNNKARFGEINEVEAYWHGLRSGRIVPLRSEIDPRGIERALSYTFILERIAPGLARFRLAGSHLNDLLGMEVRGMPFTSFFTPQARRAIMDRLEGVFDRPEVAEISIRAEKGIGRPPIDGKVILLPLRSDLGEISRIIGCLVTDGKMGRAPRRFDIFREQITVLENASHATPNIQKSTDELEVSAQFKPGQADKYTRLTTNSETPTSPKLRLVVANEQTKAPF